jgi:opacity protein-like surface antigen
MRNGIFVLCVVLAASSAAHAQTQDKNLYIEGRGGGTLVPDLEGSQLGVNFETELDIGWGVEGALGYNFPDNNFRAEAAFGYRQAAIDDLTFSGGSVSSLGGKLDGDISAFTGMLNGYYDVDLGGRVTPYIGAGIGFANVTFDLDVSVPALVLTVVDDSDFVFAYQALAGIAWHFAKNTALTIGYSYLGTIDPEFEDVSGTSFDLEYHSHNFMAGIRIGF